MATATSPKKPAWNGAFALYRPSRDAVLRNLSTLVWLALIGIGVALMVSPAASHGLLIAHVVNFLAAALLGAAEVGVLLAAVRGKRAELYDALELGRRNFVPMLLLNLLLLVTAFASIIALVVPAFFILPRLILAPYYLVDQQLGPVDAYKASWNATRGQLGKVWAVIGTVWLMILPCVTGVGIIATVYLLFTYAAATALLYEYLRRRH